MTTAEPTEAMYAELRAHVSKGFPVPPGYEKIRENLLGYEGEKMLRELLPIPLFTGAYADVAAEASRRNAEFMPYEYDDKKDASVVPLHFFPHPITFTE